MAQIRLLTKDEIECRVAQVAKDLKWCSVLLYKDARVDMRMLDEVYGTMNWQRRHEVINGNLFCTVSVWDGEKKQWIEKQDVGTESMTEAEKGQASDSFKRACFNLGIGRELYTAPQIFVTLTKDDLNQQNKVKTRFYVKSIGYTDGEISALEIVDNKGKLRFSFETPNKEGVIAKVKTANTVEELTKLFNSNKPLQADGDFIEALKLRKTEILHAAG